GALPDWGNLWQVVQNVFFFLAGLRLRAQARRLAGRRAGWRTAIALGAAYIAGLILVSLLDAQQWFGVWTALSALAVAAGVSVCALVDRWEPVAAPLRWIGQRTLPIYVIHMVRLAVVDRMVRGVDGWVFSGPVLAVLEPPLVVAVVVAASLGAHALLMRVGARALFDPLLLRPVRAGASRHQG